MPVTLVTDEAESTSVTARVLSTFLDALAAEEGYEDVAKRLRETMLTRADLSERALRTALFEGDVP